MESEAQRRRILPAVNYHPSVLASPLAMSRILMAFSFVHFVVSSWSDRDLLWAEGGVAGSIDNDFSTPALWLPMEGAVDTLGRIPVGTLGPLCLAVAVMFAVLGGRLLAVAFGLAVLTMHSLNPILLDGGDNALWVVVILLPLLIHLPLITLSGSTPHRPHGPNVVALHNTCVLVIVFQIAIVYLMAGLWKSVSSEWRNGEALAILSRSFTFDYTGWELFDQVASSFVGSMLTWSLVILQICTPIGFSIHALRRWWVYALVAMHLGIMVILGLPGFALTMIALDIFVLALDDARPDTVEGRSGRWNALRPLRLSAIMKLGSPIGWQRRKTVSASLDR